VASINPLRPGYLNWINNYVSFSPGLVPLERRGGQMKMVEQGAKGGCLNRIYRIIRINRIFMVAF